MHLYATKAMLMLEITHPGLHVFGTYLVEMQ
jgi:hypothetical protein